MGVTNYNCPLDRIYRLLREDPSVVQLLSEYGFAHSSRVVVIMRMVVLVVIAALRVFKSLNIFKESLGHLMPDMWNAGHAMMAVAVIVVLM